MWFLGILSVVAGLAMISGIRRAVRAGGSEAGFFRKLVLMLTAVALVLLGIGLILE